MEGVTGIVSRRRLLAGGASVGVGVLSGCTGFGSDTEHLSVKLLNFDSESHAVNIELFRANADRYAEAIVLRERYELETPPEDAVAYQHRESDRLENENYVVRVDLEDAPATRATYRYFPGCPDDGESDVLYVEVRTERESGDRYIEFKQNRCSGSSGWF